MSRNKNPFWMKPLAALASSRPVAAVLKHVLPVLDRRLMRMSKGRIAMTLGLPTLLLTTTGRKSGEPRAAPLLYFRHGDDLAVIGTSFGSKAHPAWYLNLQADPRAAVLLDGDEFEVTARNADEDERAVLWSLATESYEGYENYKSRVGEREVPIVVLEKANSIAARA